MKERLVRISCWGVVISFLETWIDGFGSLLGYYGGRGSSTQLGRVLGSWFWCNLWYKFRWCCLWFCNCSIRQFVTFGDILLWFLLSWRTLSLFGWATAGLGLIRCCVCLSLSLNKQEITCLLQCETVLMNNIMWLIVSFKCYLFNSHTFACLACSFLSSMAVVCRDTSSSVPFKTITSSLVNGRPHCVRYNYMITN